MTKKFIHRLCDPCSENEKMVFGEIHVFNIEKNKLERVCDACFNKYSFIQITKGIISFPFFHDKDGREWRWRNGCTMPGV